MPHNNNKQHKYDTESATGAVVHTHKRSRSFSPQYLRLSNITATPFGWRIYLRFIVLLLISFLTVIVFLTFGNIALPIGWQGITLLRTLHVEQTAPSCANLDNTAASDAVDAANVRAVVAGQRECAPVLDAHGLPTGNFSYRPTNTAAAVSVQQQQQQARENSGSNFKHPLIVHYIRIVPVDEIDDDGGPINRTTPIFDFSWQLSRIQYLAIKSAWKVLLQAKQYDDETRGEYDEPSSHSEEEDAQPTIYLHSNVKPTGFYYTELITEAHINLKWNYIEYRKSIGGRKVYVVEHVADFHKVNATFTFGGVHSDFDVLMVNGTTLRRLQNSAECFSSVDVNARSNGENPVRARHGFDFMLNCGLFSCVKQSEFLRIWRDSYMCDYRSKEWIYNSGFVPRLLLDAYKANPIALDWQSGMSWRPELLDEQNESVDTPFVKKLRAEWPTFPGLHFYHVEHYKIIWDALLRNSTSIFARAMRLAQFGDNTVQTSSNINWD